ncbi:hypothetical protein [Rhizobium leucaenae]|uniref:hypothetical protein n=1 Tax=Rhizobium leucaenae TaxID=29450 RepID=UPI00160778DC|nr:hypothetical protein [Rhizobium leucaenae]MBB6299953.1 hypothetical protein [Rhizobium leucaenae]
MGKFKVGDRVRRIGTFNCDDMRIGDTGTVTEVDSDGDCFVRSDKSGDSSFNFAQYLELVTAAPAEWQPKVGDRVVQSTESNVDIFRHWSGCFRSAFGEIIDGALVVSSIYGDQIGLSNKVGRTNFYMPSASLKLAPAPAPLTITAGRYYKTRDGRKVGPIVVAQGQSGYWSWKLASGTHYYRNDGFSCPGWAYGHRHKDDLIAEWVDEPATIANDNAAPAKFKVGDRVVSAEDGPTKGLFGVIIDDDKSEVPYRVRFEGFDDGHGANDNEWWLQASEVQFPALVTTIPAIVALIENGVALPSTRPVVHASQEAATTEASRLALLHPGQEFGVFVLADSRIADEVITKTAVLRAA